MTATLAPVYIEITPFRIVRATHAERGDGYKAVWVRERGTCNDATDWRPTKEHVRQSMAVLYADIMEVH